MTKYGMGLLRSARLTRRQLITFALVSAILNGVVTACVGAWLAQTYATQQSPQIRRDARSPDLRPPHARRDGRVVDAPQRAARGDPVP
jgi:hypothetical protein